MKDIVLVFAAVGFVCAIFWSGLSIGQAMERGKMLKQSLEHTRQAILVHERAREIYPQGQDYRDIFQLWNSCPNNEYKEKI